MADKEQQKFNYVELEKEWEAFCKEACPEGYCGNCVMLERYPHHNTAGCFAHWLNDLRRRKNNG